MRTRNASEVGAAGERKWTKWRVLWIETWLCVREEREVAVCQGHGRGRTALGVRQEKVGKELRNHLVAGDLPVALSSH